MYPGIRHIKKQFSLCLLRYLSDVVCRQKTEFRLVKAPFLPFHTSNTRSDANVSVFHCHNSILIYNMCENIIKVHVSGLLGVN